ncbi:MAG: 1-acyl-sn-glycerol-3-phosphate acyltransferase [Defluviitaleaceae bacterium]|nr:1-acyl-sn-glycerol-3-phosphate acyltransferase [Defluviitaleaceae bacterium]
MLYAFARAVVGFTYKIIFRTKVTGRENIPREGGVILCCNHQSYHDTVVLGLVSPKPVHFLAKKELFKKKFFNKLFAGLGAIPVDREKPSMDSLKRVVSTLKKGDTIGIFMQGGRQQEFDTADYKAGVALFAIKGKSPVVPIHIQSTFRMFAPIYVNVGKPIGFEEYHGAKVKSEQLNELAQTVMDAIADLGANHGS